ncbi:MAG: hypothetical protein IPK55_11070 [Streptococcus sp.]|nr:hypothetical protein [Streptococcus sp.]
MNAFNNYSNVELMNILPLLWNKAEEGGWKNVMVLGEHCSFITFTKGVDTIYYGVVEKKFGLHPKNIEEGRGFDIDYVYNTFEEAEIALNSKF